MSRLFDYIFIVLAIIGGLHAYTYAQALRNNDNMSGAILVMIVVAASVVLPIYRIAIAP